MDEDKRARNARSREPRGVIIEGEEQGARDGTFILFFGGIGAVVLSVLVLLLVLTNALGGKEDPPVVVQTAPAATSPADVRPGGTAGQSTPTAQAASPSPSQPGNGDGQGTLLRCGDILAPLNKSSRLASDCVPPDLVNLPGGIAQGQQSLRRDAAAAVERLVEAAGRDGLTLTVVSSYRSYWLQESLFNGYVSQLGLEQAERSSARPGQSEHQLGTTVDLSSPRLGFDVDAMVGTREAEWIDQNAWRFGYVVSYPRGAEPVTGYMYEPWHIRYVGLDEARAVRDSGRTLHEYLLRR